jgi:hypothetical protein
MNIEKEFLPYEQALELKELGFDEECFGFYTEEYKELIRSKYVKYPINLPTKPFLAPTFSQAFRWFRDNHKLVSWVYNSDDSKFYYTILQNGRFVKANDYMSTHEETELECLKKLIEIVKYNHERI